MCSSRYYPPESNLRASTVEVVSRTVFNSLAYYSEQGTVLLYLTKLFVWWLLIPAPFNHTGTYYLYDITL